jgi:hypothetical protein
MYELDSCIVMKFLYRLAGCFWVQGFKTDVMGATGK